MDNDLHDASSDKKPNHEWKSLFAILVGMIGVQGAAFAGIKWYGEQPLRWTTFGVIALPMIVATIIGLRLRFNKQAGHARWQFGMGTLILLMSLICIWFALTVKDQEDRLEWHAQRRQLIALMKESISGGEVRFSGNQPLLDVRVKRGNFDDDDLAELLKLVQTRTPRVGIYFLSLEGTSITDEGLGLLKDCRRLQYLILDGTKVTDLGLQQIADLPKLSLVSAGKTQVSKKVLKRLNEK